VTVANCGISFSCTQYSFRVVEKLCFISIAEFYGNEPNDLSMNGDWEKAKKQKGFHLTTMMVMMMIIISVRAVGPLTS
jgi:hypothetical protein